MSKLSNRAEELFYEGFNCSQAVLGSFCEKYGMKQEDAFAIATGLGGGIRCGEVCGAVSGAVLVIGLKYGNKNQNEGNSKALCYAKTTEFINRFKERKGSIVCRELLGYDLSKEGEMKEAAEKEVFKEVCPKMIKEAVEVLEELNY